MSGLPQGWRRGVTDDGPGMFIDHESKLLRISRSGGVVTPTQYTVWLKENGEWIRPYCGGADRYNLNSCIKAAEELI